MVEGVGSAVIAGKEGQIIGLIGLQTMRASLAVTQNIGTLSYLKVTPEFQIDDLVLVAYRKALDHSCK